MRVSTPRKIMKAIFTMIIVIGIVLTNIKILCLTLLQRKLPDD